MKIFQSKYIQKDLFTVYQLDMLKQRIPAKIPKGTKIEKLKVFGRRLPYALFWYVGRSIRQNFNLFWFKTIGRYGFSSIGKNCVIDGFPSFIWPCSKIKLQNNVRIGKNCVFQGGPNSTIILKNRVTINNGCVITSLFSIEIGENTSIGEYTSIRDYNHAFDNLAVPIKDQGYQGGPIIIGNNCWIGRGCAILPGVVIEEGVIIGANSVVTRNIPANSIAVGSPAKVIKMRTND